MNAISNLTIKSTFFTLICFLVAKSFPQPANAENKAHANLPANFDSEFRFNNSNNLKGKIAFTATINNFDRILVLNLDQKRIEKLIDGPGNNSYPRWSPKGDKIAFTSDRDGNLEIYLANSDGSNQTRLTNNKQIDDNASWTPDGKEIVYFSEMPDSGKQLHTNLFAVNAETKQIRQITNLKGKNSTPAVSPRGWRIAYTTNRFWPGWDVCIYNLKNNTDSCPLSGTTTYCRPSWSPDGKQIAFSSGLLSDIDAYILDVPAGNTEAIAKTSGNDYDLAWGNEGNYIAFVSDKDQKENYNIYLTKVKDNPDNEILSLLSGPYSMRYLSWFETQPQLPEETKVPE